MNYLINHKNELELFTTSNWERINRFIQGQTEKLPIPLYSSVDIRESKTKIAPVDHNFYPAGFNNLCQLDLDASSQLFSKCLQKLPIKNKNIAIITESHSKNKFYLDHLIFLGRAIQDAGYNVDYISFDDAIFPENKDTLTMESASRFDITIKKGCIKKTYLYSEQKQYGLAILNNDQSQPIKIDWQSLKTPVHPYPQLGWNNRNKSHYFSAYSNIVNIFSKEFSINPCIIQAEFLRIDNIDFSSKAGFENLANHTEILLKKLPENRKVFIKSNQGTYGMGIMVVSDKDQVLNMNRKIRNKMNIGKNNIKTTSVLIQEAIESIVQYNGYPAEVAIYLVDGKAAGGFLRTHSQKSSFSNLNSKGMVFKKYCISEIKENNDTQLKEALYSIIAMLATWASGIETQQILDY